MKEDTEISAVDHRGDNFEIPFRQLKMMRHGTLYERTENINRTQLVKILINSKGTVFTVNFKKKVKPEDVAERLKGFKFATDFKRNHHLLSQEFTEG